VRSLSTRVSVRGRPGAPVNWNFQFG